MDHRPPITHSQSYNPDITTRIAEETDSLLRNRQPSSRAYTLKRKSAYLSDLISSHSHSSAPSDIATPLSAQFPGESTPAGAGGYDGEFRQELEKENGGVGIRLWYENFTTIDWLHDSIKSSIRLRRLRRKGKLANIWEELSGWILVTMIGAITACIAYLIITFEMILFDLKDGYCTTSIMSAKRFCCPVLSTPVALRPSIFKSIFTIGLSGGEFDKKRIVLQQVAIESCKNWRTWGEVWEEWTNGGIYSSWTAEYIAFIIIAVSMAVLASTLTIYLSDSTSVYSSKDSVNVPVPGFGPDYPSYCTINSESDTSNQGFQKREKLFPTRAPKQMYFAAGSGIPEIKCILSGFVLRGYLGAFTLATKSIGLVFSVASGLSLGKEGPFVQISACVGNICSRFFHSFDTNEAKRREIISSACAAGVSVSFGAPIGGVLFSLEEVSYFFPPSVMWRAFWCSMIAATCLKLLDPFGNGKIVLLAVTYDRDWHTFELLGFLLLGFLGGVFGGLFCKANIWWTKNIRNKVFKSHPVIEVALVTLLTVVVSFFNPFAKMGGVELVSELFTECHRDQGSALCVSSPELVWDVVISITTAMTIKISLTVITFGLKLPAGIFIPTLAVGACAGRVLGLLVELVHSSHPEAWIFESCRIANDGPSPLPFGSSCIVPGVWAMVSAASFLAGVTRTTVSLVVIMLELTGSVNYVVPVMLAVLIAKSVADVVEPRSIYDLVIELSNLPFLDPKTAYAHEATPGDIMDIDAPVISLDEDNTIGDLREKLASLYENASSGGFAIVGKSGSLEGVRMYGYLASKELEFALTHTLADLDSICTFRIANSMYLELTLPRARIPMDSNSMDLSYLMDSAPITVSVRAPMEIVHEMFVKLGCRYIIVVDEHSLYLGVIEKNRYLAYLGFLEKRVGQGYLPRSTTMNSHV